MRNDLRWNAYPPFKNHSLYDLSPPIYNAKISISPFQVILTTFDSPLTKAEVPVMQIKQSYKNFCETTSKELKSSNIFMETECSINILS